MRIVAGTYRSRVIKAVPSDKTRPTADKIKEAIFSRIGPYFDGGEMLDLFCGSGNMAIEALSRGMDHVIASDHAQLAIQTTKDNLKTLSISEVDIWKSDYLSTLKKCDDLNKKFDLIYLDPPYALGTMNEILSFIDEKKLLQDEGNIICESLKKDAFSNDYENFELVKEATYGITKITYYRGKI